MGKTFILNEPLDMHLHLRDGDMLRLVAPLTSNSFSGALVMPNLVPPVTTKEALLSYKKRIIESCKDDNFTPYMTLFFQNNYSFEFFLLREVSIYLILVEEIELNDSIVERKI